MPSIATQSRFIRGRERTVGGRLVVLPNSLAASQVVLNLKRIFYTARGMFLRALQSNSDGAAVSSMR